MKKICFITTISLTLNTFVLKAAEYIHNNTDWDISFICDYDKSFADSLPDYIRYIPVPMERGISLKGISAVKEMRRIFLREKFDLIQYSTPNASLYAALAGKSAKIPVRLYCQWGMAFVGFSGFKRTVLKCIEKLICSLSTWIEPDSIGNLNFSHSEKLYPKNKGSVIWNGSACGIDLNKFDITKREIYRHSIRDKFGINSNSFVFGFVGRITRDKGINELFQAFKKLLDNKNDCYLLVVGPDDGDSSVNDDLYSWAKECDRVIFVGYTNIVEQYLSAMDLYVLPSYREGFGMGVVEAQAMGVPVVVTDIPGPTDAMLNGKTGMVISNRSADSLYSALKELLYNNELLVEYSVNGVDFAKKNFDQSIFFEMLLSDRKRLLNDK